MHLVESLKRGREGGGHWCCSFGSTWSNTCLVLWRKVLGRKFWGKRVLWPDIFLGRKVFGQETFGARMFWARIFPKEMWARKKEGQCGTACSVQPAPKPLHNLHLTRVFNMCWVGVMQGVIAFHLI